MRGGDLILKKIKKSLTKGGKEKNKKKFDKRRKGGRNAWLFKFAWYCLIKLVVQQV